MSVHSLSSFPLLFPRAGPNSLQTPLLETSGQTTGKTGTQADPSNKKWDHKKYVTAERARWNPTRPNATDPKATSQNEGEEE